MVIIIKITEVLCIFSHVNTPVHTREICGRDEFLFEFRNKRLVRGKINAWTTGRIVVKGAKVKGEATVVRVGPALFQNM